MSFLDVGKVGGQIVRFMVAGWCCALACLCVMYIFGDVFVMMYCYVGMCPELCNVYEIQAFGS